VRYVRSTERRAPIGMIHHKRPLAAKLVLDGKGRTNGAVNL
jgi:hypothetical protein